MLQDEDLKETPEEPETEGEAELAGPIIDGVIEGLDSVEAGVGTLLVLVPNDVVDLFNLERLLNVSIVVLGAAAGGFDSIVYEFDNIGSSSLIIGTAIFLSIFCDFISAINSCSLDLLRV
ncbi:hypothetical protein WICPIJ_005921 [Wickerhamomyces pijperi]|uniref:Uncharacterized protein n=1 Tax=Wickerhamomyces pijperi TaxID=599730 RepID=A0A9P8Q2Z6_WICPI|nr:hypothetical protein WICPIJ_005921 [Wickerhamomyces pijperi]